MLYVAFIKDKSIDRIEFDWTEPLIAIELVRDLIKRNYPSTWEGDVYIDDKPILSDDSDPMFLARAVRGNDNSVDFRVSILAWKFPSLPED